MTDLAAPEGDLIVSTVDGCLAITFNRPEMANALTADQSERLITLLEEASLNPAVRVVRIAANGRHFCAGMDLRAAMSGPAPSGGPAKYPTRTMSLITTGSQRLINAVLDCTKPVVAVVQGAAAGIGLYLALASDLVVASSRASFVESFVARGMVLHCEGAHLLVGRMGLQKAKEFVFFGGKLSAQEALGYGLVTKVVEPDDLDAAAADYVGRLALAPTVALGLSKKLLNRAVGADRDTAMLEEAMAMEINSYTQDAREGGVAFMERRDPAYVGW